MIVGLDTSVVLRLLIGEPADQTQRALAFLDELLRKGDQAAIVDLVVAESYFALQHHYGISKRDALDGLRRLFAEGEIQSLGVAGAVLKTPGLWSAKPGFVDRLIHGAYTRHEAKTATFEKSAGKLRSACLL